MGVDVSTQTEHEGMAVRPWKVITGSGEFQAIVDSALEGLGPVLSSWKALAKTEEFRIFLVTALSGMKPAVETWEDVAASPEFKALVGKGLDGAQLAVKAAALIFIAITGSFYAGLASRGFDMSSADARSKISPLNQPTGVSQREEVAARQASTDAFHLAMLVAAGLLLGGAVINAIGIRQEQATAPDTAATTPGAAA